MMPMTEIPIGRPADARNIIRTRLQDRSPEIVETAVLLTDELVSNAMEHGGGRPRISVEVDASHLRVRVHDDDPRVLLRPSKIDPSSPRGRGLLIVNALATAWGVDPCESGKAVWFSLSL
jgi:two-component sensor histidine kinase